MKRILFLCVLLLISFTINAKETYVIKAEEKTKIDLSTYVSYLEAPSRFWDGTQLSYTQLQKANWTDR